MTPHVSKDQQLRPASIDERAGLSARRIVRQFRQILLWPLELAPLPNDGHVRRHHWDSLIDTSAAKSPWSEVNGRIPTRPDQVKERHYREFGSFLPHVQRLLYGERAAWLGRLQHKESPVRVFRRHDIAQVRVTVNEATHSILFNVVRVDLHFFDDVNVVILAFEIEGRDLTVECVQDLLYRFGRAYPPGWTESGEVSQCLSTVEWLDRKGRVLATSDYEQRERFFGSLCTDQSPAIAAHWEFLLAPLTAKHSETAGPLEYRLVATHRMPIMAYIAVDDPLDLTPNDYVRLGLALPAGDPATAPYASGFLKNYDSRYCYDRFYDPTRTGDWINTRVMCCGHAFVVVGDARQPFFCDAERGVLAQFRHQYFLLGLLAHFQRAALLMISDRIVRILSRLDIERPESLRRFETEIRQALEIFMRFSYRYWFTEVTDQAMPHDLFRKWSDHLATAELFAHVREELHDMNQYLDSDMLRRTSRTIVRLTVVAILSLIGTATTGFLGMNLIDETQAPIAFKAFLLGLVASLTIALTVYTIVKSARLADFLDTLADERSSSRDKLRSFLSVWSKH